MSDRAEARAAVDVRSAQMGVRLAGMDRHPDLDRELGGPRLRGQTALDRRGSFHGVSGSVEDGEEAVALAALQDDPTVMTRDLFCEKRIVAFHDPPHSIGARLP